MEHKALAVDKHFGPTQEPDFCMRSLIMKTCQGWDWWPPCPTPLMSRWNHSQETHNYMCFSSLSLSLCALNLTTHGHLWLTYTSHKLVAESGCLRFPPAGSSWGNRTQPQMSGYCGSRCQNPITQNNQEVKSNIILFCILRNNSQHVSTV